jgi:hypothetical protein
MLLRTELRAYQSGLPRVLRPIIGSVFAFVDRITRWSNTYDRLRNFQAPERSVTKPTLATKLPLSLSAPATSKQPAATSGAQKKRTSLYKRSTVNPATSVAQSAETSPNAGGTPPPPCARYPHAWACRLSPAALRGTH